MTNAPTAKPFACPDDPKTATCWDCGYTWEGQ